MDLTNRLQTASAPPSSVNINLMNDNSQIIGDFFDRQWNLYQRAIQANILCHDEMFRTLDSFLTSHFGYRPFRFADLGCGDASAVLNTLRNKAVAHYIGVDAAEDLIAKASHTLQPLPCEKTLICGNMETVLNDLPGPVDVIFCSYSLHHLRQAEKKRFINGCYEALNTPGYFILVDGVAMDHETREQWLERLEERFRTMVPDFTAEDTAQMMQHPREFDHPETIATFRTIANQSPWISFDVLLERDDFLAFLVFSKGTNLS
jgi:SAM-dependent methyltransferase